MLIDVKDVYKQFKQKEVLKGVSFSLRKGEIVGLLGPNGVGKTTMIKMLCNISKPTSGTIQLAENTKLAVLFDYNGLYVNFTALENLELYYDGVSETTPETVLKTVELWENKDKKVKTFSKGMLRKLTIARALLQNPDVLILDEPFDGLDIKSRDYWIKFLTNWVSDGKHSIIISSHIMSDIDELCHRLVVLQDGKVATDKWIKDLKNDHVAYFKVVFLHEFDNDVIHNILRNYRVSYSGEQKSKEILIYDIEPGTQHQVIKAFVEADLFMEEFVCNKESLTDIYMNIVEGGK